MDAVTNSQVTVSINLFVFYGIVMLIVCVALLIKGIMDSKKRRAEQAAYRRWLEHMRK